MGPPATKMAGNRTLLTGQQSRPTPMTSRIAKTFQLGREVYAIALAGPLYRMESNAEAHIARLVATCTTIGATG